MISAGRNRLLEIPEKAIRPFFRFAQEDVVEPGS